MCNGQYNHTQNDCCSYLKGESVERYAQSGTAGGWMFKIQRNHQENR